METVDIVKRINKSGLPYGRGPVDWKLNGKIKEMQSLKRITYITFVVGSFLK